MIVSTFLSEVKCQERRRANREMAIYWRAPGWHPGRSPRDGLVQPGPEDIEAAGAMYEPRQKAVSGSIFWERLDCPDT